MLYAGHCGLFRLNILLSTYFRPLKFKDIGAIILSQTYIGGNFVSRKIDKKIPPMNL